MQEREVVFQCCYCKLPERKDTDRVSHGYCKGCLLIHHPEVYALNYDEDGNERAS